MTVETLFEQLKELRKHVTIPVFLMGYVNPLLQYGVERFCADCKKVGVDGIIVPDLPMYEYEELYKNVFEQNDVANIFIVTPQTSEERIRKIDNLSNSFIYLLSSNATTGTELSVGDKTTAYFQRIKDMDLKSPLAIGFGISNRQSFEQATTYATGAIIGTAFVKLLAKENYLDEIPNFIKSIKG